MNPNDDLLTHLASSQVRVKVLRQADELMETLLETSNGNFSPDPSLYEVAIEAAALHLVLATRIADVKAHQEAAS